MGHIDILYAAEKANVLKLSSMTNESLDEGMCALQQQLKHCDFN